MKKAIVILIMAAAIVVSAFRREHGEHFSVPKGWPKPVYDFSANPLSKAKIELGKRLFFDPVLSADHSISCASCHLPQTAFTHVDHGLSHGIGGKIGNRNSPSLINLAWSESFMWDGAVHNLDVQPLAPISNPLEMGETIQNVVKKLQASSFYPSYFKAAFGDSVISGEHVLKALSQFMLTFVSSDSKYDQVMRHEPGAQFTEQEVKGYALFKANCSSCHKEPLFTNEGFENNGLAPDTSLHDIGLMKVTRLENDRNRFKVPTLRNVEVSYPYMHDGRFKNLQMVIFHYTSDITSSATLSPQLKRKIVMTEDDKRNLILFLKTLTDGKFLHNPDYQMSAEEIAGGMR